MHKLDNVDYEYLFELKGYLNGIWVYSIWENGEQFVGVARRPWKLIKQKEINAFKARHKEIPSEDVDEFLRAQFVP